MRRMMQHAWTGYAEHAWGHNEVRPDSCTGHSESVFGSGPLGATIVDSLDTLHVMGLAEEFERGREWVRTELDLRRAPLEARHAADLAGAAAFGAPSARHRSKSASATCATLRSRLCLTRCSTFLMTCSRCPTASSTAN